jgi:hypothetical protein
MTEQTYYRWKAKYGGMELSEMQRLKALEDENRGLKQIVAEQTLDIQALKAVVAKKWEHHGSARGGGVAPTDAQHEPAARLSHRGAEYGDVALSPAPQRGKCAAGRAAAQARGGAQPLRLSPLARADRARRHHGESQTAVSPLSRRGPAGAAPPPETRASIACIDLRSLSLNTPCTYVRKARRCARCPKQH